MFKISDISTPSTQNQKFVSLITKQSPLKFVITQKPNSHTKKKNQADFLNDQTQNNLNGRWSREEHCRFIEAIITFGNDWKKVQKHVATRTSTQARSHAQKFLMKLKHSDYLKRKNINLNFSWAKAIQYIKNQFTESELNEIFHSISNKKHLLLKGINFENQKEFSLDEINTVDSISTQEDCINSSLTKFNYYNSNFYDNNEESFKCGKKEESDCFKNFIQNFNAKSKDDYDFGDVDKIYYQKNIN